MPIRHHFTTRRSAGQLEHMAPNGNSRRGSGRSKKERRASDRFEVPWVQSAFDRVSADPKCEEFLTEINRRLG